MQENPPQCKVQLIIIHYCSTINRKHSWWPYPISTTTFGIRSMPWKLIVIQIYVETTLIWCYHHPELVITNNIILIMKFTYNNYGSLSTVHSDQWLMSIYVMCIFKLKYWCDTVFVGRTLILYWKSNWSASFINFLFIILFPIYHNIRNAWATTKCIRPKRYKYSHCHIILSKFHEPNQGKITLLLRTHSTHCCFVIRDSTITCHKIPYKYSVSNVASVMWYMVQNSLHSNANQISSSRVPELYFSCIVYVTCVTNRAELYGGI